MADTKITALAAITTVDPAADVLPIVDVSDTSMAASGTTKKITSNQILGAGGTATLASATITGDLTVDTSTLKVDSTNHRVGVLTATPAYPLDVLGASAATVASGAAFRAIRSSSGDRCLIVPLAAGSGFTIQSLNAAESDFTPIIFSGSTTTFNYRTGVGTVTTGITLDTSGNLLVGVTSANASGGVLQLKSGITFPATQVASSDANTLDDYEEGTWTGTLGGSTANPTTPVTATGKYTKIGRQVSIQIAFVSVDTTGASNRILLTGLPFAASSSPNGITGSVLFDSMATFTGSPGVYLTQGTTQIDIYSSVSNSGLASVTHNAGSARSLWLNVTYTA